MTLEHVRLQVFARAVGTVSDAYTNVPCLELRVYSDQSLGWDCVEDPEGGCCPCEIDLSRLLWSYAHPRNGRSCRSPGHRGTAALGASAASGYSYAAIDRPGTCSPYERSGVDSGTAAAGPASA